MPPPCRGRIQLNAAPTASVPDGIYQFKIRVSADNAAGGDIPVAVSVTNSSTGNVLFNASDIYTATLDANGNTIPGLAGDRIVHNAYKIELKGESMRKKKAT